MKFWANVGLDEENAGALVRAFFKEFHPDSSIHIEGRAAKVEIFFDELPPQEIVEAISHCKIIELHSGKVVEDYFVEEKEPKAQVEDSMNSEDEIQGTEKDVPEVTAEINQNQVKEESDKDEALVSEKKKHSKAQGSRRGKMSSKEAVNIPELEEFAKKATSFENFTELIASWIGMGKRKEFFLNLVMTSVQIEHLSWKKIEAAMSSKQLPFNENDKIMVTRKIAKVFNDRPVRLLSLLETIKKYKDCSFTQEPSNQDECDKHSVNGKIEPEVAAPEDEIAPSSTNMQENELENPRCIAEGEVEYSEPNANNEEGKNVTESEVVASDVPALCGNEEKSKPKSRVKMDCMPEIPEFEEALASIDKSKSIEDRVWYVLTVMGVNNLQDNKQQETFEIVNAAVRLRNITNEAIFAKTSITREHFLVAMLTLARLISDFAKKYSETWKVKTTVFLKQLQEILVREEEIEDI